LDYQSSSSNYKTTDLSSSLTLKDNSRVRFYISHTEDDIDYVSNNFSIGGSTLITDYYNFGTSIGFGSNTDDTRSFNLGISNGYEISHLWNADLWITFISMDIDYKSYSQDTIATKNNGKTVNSTETYSEKSFTLNIDQDFSEYVTLSFSATKNSYSDKTLSVNISNRANQTTTVTDVIESSNSTSLSFYLSDYFDIDISSGSTIYDNSEYDSNNTGYSFTLNPTDSYSIVYSYDQSVTKTESIITNTLGFSVYWD
jgi:hypothetical protein